MIEISQIAQHEQAADTQVRFLDLCRQMRHFEYRADGRFRGWLRTVARRAWCDALSARQRHTPGSGDTAVAGILASVPAGEEFLDHLDCILHLEPDGLTYRGGHATFYTPTEEIPVKLEFDISHLKLGEALHVRDLKLPTGVKPAMSSGETIASIVAPRADKVAEEAAAAAAADAAAAAAVPMAGAAPAPGAAPVKGAEAKPAKEAKK